MGWWGALFCLSILSITIIYTVLNVFKKDEDEEEGVVEDKRRDQQRRKGEVAAELIRRGARVDSTELKVNMIDSTELKLSRVDSTDLKVNRGENLKQICLFFLLIQC